MYILCIDLIGTDIGTEWCTSSLYVLSVSEIALLLLLETIVHQILTW